MPTPGEVLAGRYELIQPIGSGGMAVVWRARDRRLARYVAVKVLRPEYAEDAEFVRRFAFEAQNAASLSHPNVATVYDTDVDGDHRFIVMELVDGPSLAEIIAERGPIEPVVAVDIVAAAARALAAAHRRGLIHRDVKPANLLIGQDGRVRLADFGIARALTSNRVTQPGTVLGSIPYLSPEQARGADATAAGDIYSLGVVLFELLTGSLPWAADTPAGLATARLYTPAPALSETAAWLPKGLDSIIARALEVDVSKRYPSARVFADALGAWGRRNRAPMGGRDGVRHATTALAGGLGTSPPRPVAVAASVGVARPNASAVMSLGRGRTRPGMGVDPPRDRPRGMPKSSVHPPAVAGSAGPAGALGEGDDRRRRAGWLFAAVALLLVGSVVAAFLRSPVGGPAASIVPGGVVGPSPTVLAVVPTPTLVPSPSPTMEPTPSVTPSPSPTSPPTPRPTVRPLPASTPAAAVVAFYNAVEDHDWDTAIDLWSASMQRRYPPDGYLIGRFRPTTRIDITRLRTVSVDQAAGTARVEVTLVEYRTVEPSPRTFVGAWDLRRIDGRWVLDDPDF